MTRALSRRLQRLLDRAAPTTPPERQFTRLHVFDLMPPCKIWEACERPSWSAHLDGETDLSGFGEAWLVEADSPDALEVGLASLIAAGDVPEGEWRRSASPGCPGGSECTHLPRIILGDGTTVSAAEFHAMEGRA